jgi:hypothetical protein
MLAEPAQVLRLAAGATQAPGREEGKMPATAKTRFAELLGSAREALRDVGSRPPGADSHAVFRAVTAASRAAGFIEGVTISDPTAARDMVAEFESLVSLAEKTDTE